MKNKIYKLLLIFVLIFSVNVVKASEEKSYGFIPEQYDNVYKIDTTKYKSYTNRGVYSFYSAIPSKYDLRNVNGKRLVPPVDDQSTAPFCWAFASNNTIESYYLMHGLGEIDLSDNQPAYVSNYYGDGLYGFYSGNSVINILKYWFLGHSPVTEEKFGAYTVNQVSKNYSDYLDSSNLEFDIENAIVFPRLLTDKVIQDYSISEAQRIMSEYNADIKNHIMNNGAVFTGIYMYFLNEKTNFMYDDGTVSKDIAEVGGTAHAVTIVGWDDTIEGAKINGTAVKGAWIAMNSWGNEQQYFYISYYDRSVVDSLLGVQKIDTKEWNNVYSDHKIVSNTPNKKIYEFKKNEGEELIDSVKIYYKDANSNIKVSISDGYNIYDSITDELITFGIKTYKFDNVSLNSDKIYVIVDSSYATEYYDVAVFTQDSGVVKELEIRDETFNNSQSTFKKFQYDVITKGIISGTSLNIKVYDDQNADVTSKFTIKKSIIVNGYASLELNVKTQGSLEYSKYLKIQVTAGDTSKVVTQYNNGTGAQSDPYIIREPYELILLDQQGFFFELGNDIDLYEETNSMFGYFYNSSQGWNPVTFKSVLDGKGYSIKNLTTTKGSMFESIDSGVIKNIKIDGYKITDTNNSTSIPGIITKTLKNNGTISNIFIDKSEIKANSNSVGGLVGIVYDGTIENVHIKDTKIDSNYYSGIIVSKVLNPTNSINIKNVYSTDTSITGNKKGMIGIVEITTSYNNIKPINIFDNIIQSNNELSIIGLENLNISGTDQDIYIAPEDRNHIVTDSEIYNEELFNKFDLENTWRFDQINSAYLLLFEKDFNNLLKLNTYEIQDDMISKVKSNTRIADFITNITNIKDLEYKIYSSNGTELSSDNTISTGNYIDVSNEVSSKRYYIVVTGDTDGNGTCGAMDAYAIVLHSVGKKELKGSYLLAADYNLDGSVGARDAYAIILDSLN